MTEEIIKLAKTIVEYSIDVQPKERVMISFFSDDCKDIVKELITQISVRGGIPYYKRLDKELDSLLLKQNNSDLIDILVKYEEFNVNNYDSIIFVKYTENEYENKLVPALIKHEYDLKIHPIQNIRVNKRKWVLFNYPSLIDLIKHI